MQSPAAPGTTGVDAFIWPVALRVGDAQLQQRFGSPVRCIAGVLCCIAPRITQGPPDRSPGHRWCCKYHLGKTVPRTNKYPGGFRTRRSRSTQGRNLKSLVDECNWGRIAVAAIRQAVVAGVNAANDTRQCRRAVMAAAAVKRPFRGEAWKCHGTLLLVRCEMRSLFHRHPGVTAGAVARSVSSAQTLLLSVQCSYQQRFGSLPCRIVNVLFGSPRGSRDRQIADQDTIGVVNVTLAKGRPE